MSHSITSTEILILPGCGETFQTNLTLQERKTFFELFGNALNVTITRKSKGRRAKPGLHTSFNARPAVLSFGKKHPGLTCTALSHSQLQPLWSMLVKIYPERFLVNEKAKRSIYYDGSGRKYRSHKSEVLSANRHHKVADSPRLPAAGQPKCAKIGKMPAVVYAVLQIFCTLGESVVARHFSGGFCCLQLAYHINEWLYRKLDPAPKCQAPQLFIDCEVRELCQIL